MFDVLTLGTVTHDTFLESEKFKALHDANLPKKDFPTGEAECFALGSKIAVEALHNASGGDAGNASVTFARAGLKTGFLSKIGNDMSGVYLKNELKIEAVKLLTKPSRKNKSDQSVILLSPQGERTILVYRGASKDFSSADIPKTARAKWWYVAPGIIPPAIILPALKRAKKAGSKIAFNPSGHYIQNNIEVVKEICALADVVITNREEASRITGKPYENLKEIFKAFDRLVSGIAVLTDGSLGAYASDGGTLYRIKPFTEKQLKDRTGAGDAFGSAFVLGLIQNKDIGNALKMASANATSVVEHIGAREGILKKKDYSHSRWQDVDLDIESIHS